MGHMRLVHSAPDDDAPQTEPGASRDAGDPPLPVHPVGRVAQARARSEDIRRQSKELLDTYLDPLERCLAATRLYVDDDGVVRCSHPRLRATD